MEEAHYFPSNEQWNCLHSFFNFFIAIQTPSPAAMASCDMEGVHLIPSSSAISLHTLVQ